MRDCKFIRSGTMVAVCLPPRRTEAPHSGRGCYARNQSVAFEELPPPLQQPTKKITLICPHGTQDHVVRVTTPQLHSSLILDSGHAQRVGSSVGPLQGSAPTGSQPDSLLCVSRHLPEQPEPPPPLAKRSAEGINATMTSASPVVPRNPINRSFISIRTF